MDFSQAALLGLPQPPSGALTARLHKDVWWTDGGYIRVCNQETGEFASMDVERFKHRVQAVEDMLEHSRRENGGKALEDRLYKNMARFVDRGRQLIRACLETVDREDQSSVNARRRSRPVSISLTENPTFSL